MNKKESVWIDLYNALYIMSSKYKDIQHLESPVFDVFEELDTAIMNGLKDSNLALYFEEEWITLTLYQEFKKFGEYINSISSELWNESDFDKHPDWELARKWAVSLLSKIGEKKRGWDSTGDTIVFSEVNSKNIEEE